MLSVTNLNQSRWSLLLCALAGLALAIMPMGAAAKVFLSGGDDLGGDPLDGNDHGTSGSGGGTDDDIHDALNVTPIPERVDRPTLFGFYFVIIPSRTNVIGFQLTFLPATTFVLAEGAYAR